MTSHHPRAVKSFSCPDLCNSTEAAHHTSEILSSIPEASKSFLERHVASRAIPPTASRSPHQEKARAHGSGAPAVYLAVYPEASPAVYRARGWSPFLPLLYPLLYAALYRGVPRRCTQGWAPFLLLLTLSLSLPLSGSAEYGVGPENSTATFYGERDGSGADMGGACGYGNLYETGIVLYCNEEYCTVLCCT